jgi:hypothetical protein
MDVAKRKEACSLLRYIRVSQSEAWICTGDFNEIIEEGEKYGAAENLVGRCKSFMTLSNHASFMILAFWVLSSHGVTRDMIGPSLKRD